MPDMKPAISAVTPKPEQAGSAIAREHERQDFVVAVAAGRDGRAFADKFHGQHGEADQAGKNHDKGHEHFEGAPMIGAIFAARRSLADSTRCTTRKSVVQ